MKSLILTALLLAIPVHAVPLQLSYQATVTDSDGNLIAPTAPIPLTVDIRIWDNASGGDLLWSERHDPNVFKGRFSVILGDGLTIPGIATPADPDPGPEARGPLNDIFTEPGRFVELTIPNIDGNGSSRTFAPRQKLAVSATALRTLTAESMAPGSLLAADLVDGSINSDVISANSISGDKIADNNISRDQLAAGAISSAEIQDGAIQAGTAVIQAGSLTGADLKDAAVDTVSLADGAVTSPAVADGSLLLADFADNGINGNVIVSGSLSRAKIGANLSAPTLLDSTKIRRLTGGSKGQNTANLDQAVYGLPTGINGVMLKVSPSASHLYDNYVVFNAGDGVAPSFPGATPTPDDIDSNALSFPSSADDFKAARSNSMVTNRINKDTLSTLQSGFDRSSLVYCPVQVSSPGQYVFTYYSPHLAPIITVIGYY